MVFYGIFSILLIVMYFILSMKAKKTYAMFVERYKSGSSLVFMAPVSLYIIDRLNIIDRLYSRISFVQRTMISLYGSRDALQYTKMFLAQLISTVLICLLGSSVFALLSQGDTTIFIAGCIITVMVPVVMFKRIINMENERRNAIVTELPEVVNKIVLLINAGETVQQALIRCVATKQAEDGPLYKDLREAVNKLTSNEPFHSVMNELSKNCGIQEVSIFTTTILLNYRKGGHDLVLALRELSHELWEKRKSISKTKGEEASSKLVFPLVLIFVAVMIIVGYPALSLL
ncbi:type II secretion system F family protein [Pullulanibacillus pueri]|uniref:Type II secretion system protein GspF domain-containing protein n=1 Tax=Pullulanibacillus pueri TaxID=1437324 RepID=A0A8J3EL88_9BACL|nr:type II secretion system F family protein [Pullulanibacillus pueri]GGH77607.1 hypothetical protein GCM10007096_09750 [Pullulanibacillus pueri]